MLRQSWWKLLSIILLTYTLIAGFLGGVPEKPILNESIRNLYFHVAMWFSMMIFLIISLVYSIRYLRSGRAIHDIYALEYANAGIVFGLLGLITGAVWARYTWGDFWSNDPKQLGAAIALLIYLAYLVLRNSMTDLDKRARIAAVYNIFAFAMLFPTIWIIPRMVDSLHPGGMGNPAFNTRDIDSRITQSTPVDNAQTILLLATAADVIGIDEAQFFDDQLPEVCDQLALSGKRVIVAGLDMDYQSKPFGQMPFLLAKADYITKLHAICMRCGNIASYSYRKLKDPSQFLLGEKDLYEPRCRTCFFKVDEEDVFN